MIDKTSPTLLDLELRHPNGHTVSLVGTAEAWQYFDHRGELPAGTRIDAHEATVDDVRRVAAQAGFTAMRIHQGAWKPLAPPQEEKAAPAPPAPKPTKSAPTTGAHLRRVRHHLLQAIAHMDAGNPERMRPHLAKAAQITIEYGD